MAQRPQVTFAQKQRLAVTKSMQQSVRILAMSNSQLIDFLKTEEAENPILELEFHGDGQLGSGSSISAVDFISDTVAERETLVSGLVRQLASVKTEKNVRDAAEILIGNLNEKGSLEGSMNEIAREANIPEETLKLALTLVQGLEPAGVGARGAFECIELQLRAAGLWTAAYGQLLTHLSKGVTDVNIIARHISLEKERVREMMEIVRQTPLDMSEQISADATIYFEPDVLFARNEVGNITVSLNEAIFPKISVRPDSLRNTRNATQEARSYVEAHRKRVSWLSNALRKRAETIFRISISVSEIQKGFFDSGAIALTPLTMKKVAKEIGIHESTVSRAIAGKFFQCDFGTFPMRYLFPSAVEGGREGSVPGTSIRMKINRLVAMETANDILSDAKIREILAQDGITVARRTVAKYRESMNVPASSIRRIEKRIKQRD